MKKILLLICILITNISCFAQKIGDWTAHSPGLKTIGVEIMQNKIFAATPFDIYYYNTNDNSINHLSKVTGLSDIGISVIKYSKQYNALLVGYSNTNIDIIDNYDNVTNIPDIKNKYILGNKTINNVFFNGRYAYVCCGFGIVVIDLKRHEVKDTYIIGENGSYLGVNDLTICDNIFYAATENGIYYADASNNHLADFSQWKRFMHHMPNPNGNYSHVVTFDNYVVANYSDNQSDSDLFYMLSDTTTWSNFLDGQQLLTSDLRVCDDRLVITQKDRGIKVYDKNKSLIFDESGMEPLAATYDKSRNCYWAATTSNSLVKISTEGKLSKIIFNGPYSANTFSINASGNDVWVAAGGYSSTWAPLYNRENISHYDGNRWSYINYKNTPAMDTIFDVTCVKSDPRNSSIAYASTYSRGIVMFENGKFKKNYSYYNSSLGLHTGWLSYGLKYCDVTSFDFDSNNNIWLANNGAEKMLSVWKTDGTWHSYNIGSGSTGEIMVDKNDIKWIYIRPGEIVVFNGTTKTVNKNSTTGALPGDATCFATDSNGTVWVGTTDGVALFKDSNQIFRNKTYACTRILIPRNDGTGQADYLLSGQSILSIAVDGADNLWFGTYNGAIHISNDGMTTYHHFTMDNSPLFSNTVKDIAIDDDGNVYFATDYGVISYKGTATVGNEKNSNVIVYPNPVRPEHQGIVGIKGLVTNALVKITTTNGVFVTHLKAQGGQAVWDCTDIYGNKVEPGIYLIFASDETGKETYATKVLIMK